MPHDVVELLQALVKIQSVNPHGNPGVDQPGEAACAEFVADFLRGCGAEVELREVRPGRPNVIGRFPAPGKKRVLLAPHLDTVSVVGMTVDPFGAELRDGRIYGRGATDTKGPMAAMLWALYEMRGRMQQLGAEIWFVGLMGEEAGQEGSRAFARELLAQTDVDPGGMFALIGEPTNLQIVHTTKGAMWVTLTTRGKAVHSSAPDSGVNAIYKMTDAIRCVREEIAPELSRMRDAVLGSPTISVGTIAGGSKTNIVPDVCRAEIDVRTIPGQDTEAILTKLRSACPGIELEVWQSKPLLTSPDHPMVRVLENNGSRCVGAPWFCDAAVFAEAGIPAVAAGPGSIAQAHTNDEWIAVEDLRSGVEFYRRFLETCS